MRQGSCSGTKEQPQERHDPKGLEVFFNIIITAKFGPPPPPPHPPKFTKFRKISGQLPCRSAEVKIFSVFLCQRCREIRREILVKFSVLRFPGFGCANRKISPKFHVENGVKNGKFHANFTLLGRSAEKILVSVKFLSAILGPEMGAPILWAPGIFAFFLQETSM